jgi:hypothetical protein
MAEAVLVTLPGGRWRDGRCLRDARVRPISGREETFLVEAAGLSHAELTTALLDRCVTVEPGASARELSAGDREALVLHLRRATFGDALRCVVSCPACGEQLDLDLDVRDLLVAPADDAAETYELRGGGRFRLPCGRDLEEAARAATAAGVEAAADALLRRCLDGGDEPLTAAEAAELSAAIAARDPQAEILLDVACAGCGGRFDVELDAAAFLFRELAQRADALAWEVHRLASHYHWSEAAILALSLERRQRYLELIADEDGGYGR